MTHIHIALNKCLRISFFLNRLKVIMGLVSSNTNDFPLKYKMGLVDNS